MEFLRDDDDLVTAVGVDSIPTVEARGEIFATSCCLV